MKRASLTMAISVLGYYAMAAAVDDPTKYTALTSVRLMQHSVPTYFVAPALLHACVQTAPPEDFRYDDLKWPMEAMLFILPAGSLNSPANGACIALAIARHSPATSLLNLKGLAPTMGQVDKECFSYFAATEDGASFAGFAPTDSNPQLKDLLSGKGSDAPGFAGLSDSGAVTFEAMSSSESEFLNLLQSVGLQLLLLLNARPDLVESGRELRKANLNPKKAAIALWSPNVIGVNFRVQGSDGAASDVPRSAAAPRMHWRRGHYRSQPHGAGFTLRRIIWIEPVLVAAG